MVLITLLTIYIDDLPWPWYLLASIGLRWIVQFGSVLYFFTTTTPLTEFPTKKKALALLAFSVVMTALNFFIMYFNPEEGTFRTTIWFIEFNTYYQGFYCFILYLKFDSFVDELMFEFVRDNVYRQSLDD
jgi:hypothetical protein